MSQERPSQIQKEHVEKFALGYSRQSTIKQVKENTGSADYQRSQVNRAIEWGWPPDRIKIIDEDLGKSGTSTDDREGFLELLRLVEQGRVGIILCSNASRLSRAPVDFENLVMQCRRNNTLLAMDGQILDLNNSLSRLLARIQGSLAEYENELRKQTFWNGKVGRMEKGYAISRPPAGLITVRKGVWAKDPDRTVQQAIEDVFRAFREYGTATGVLRYLVRQKQLLPNRLQGKLEWTRPSHWRVYAILKNPAYAGIYCYRRRETIPGDSKHRVRSVSRDKWMLYYNRHEGYITPDEWARNIEQLKANRSIVRQPIGRGLALCQGLVRCGRCGRQMNTRYYLYRGSHGVTYSCQQAQARYGDAICWHVFGRALDDLVATEVLRSFPPVDIEAIIEAAGEVNDRYDRAVRRREQELQDARYQVELAKRRHEAVEPEHRRVAAALEKEREEAIERREQVERRHWEAPLAPPLELTSEVVTTLRNLAHDVPTLWTAPSTLREDRKALVRLLIKEIRLVEMSDAYSYIEIMFVGGVTTSHRLVRPGKAIVVLKTLHAQGLDAAVIAEQLNREGFTTRGGAPYTRRMVRQLLCALARRASRVHASVAKATSIQNGATDVYAESGADSGSHRER